MLLIAHIFNCDTPCFIIKRFIKMAQFFLAHELSIEFIFILIDGFFYRKIFIRIVPMACFSYAKWIL